MRYLGVFLTAGSLLVLSSIASAQQVDAGYDLFQTDPGTSFQGAPFEGVPVGTYNFGGVVGVQNTGETDTIVQRLTNVNPTTPTTAIQMNVLQLVSVTPISLGGGPLGFYYVDLQSMDGTGPASVGSMTLSWLTNTSGTFTSSLDVFFDVHFGALNGPIVLASDALLSNGGAAWSDLAPPGSVLINGVDNMLNGNNITNDFWPTPFTESEPGVTHSVSAASAVPEPATLGLLALTGVAALSRRRRSAI